MHSTWLRYARRGVVVVVVSTCCAHTHTERAHELNWLSLLLSHGLCVKLRSCVRSLSRRLSSPSNVQASHCAGMCVRVSVCVGVCLCVFALVRPPLAKYSVAINSLCYRCCVVMFLLLSIKCKPKWQLAALSTRHSTVRLQKVNSRVVVAVGMRQRDSYALCRHAPPPPPPPLLLLAERKCQLKLPFVNKWNWQQEWQRWRLQQTDDSSQRHVYIYLFVYLFIYKRTLSIGGN